MYVEDVFDYNPETGWFTNRFSRGRAREGDRAGSLVGHGYRRIVLGYNKYYEHRLAWLYKYGEWPAEVDHINGVRDDNRIANLRLCTRSQNCYNSERVPGESGLIEAYLDKRNLQWYSKIQLGGQVKFLGNHDTAQEAHEAFLAAADQYQGEFALHNRGS